MVLLMMSFGGMTRPKTSKIFYEAAFAIKISNLLICFCSFCLSCPTLEKYIFIKYLYIVLSWIVFVSTLLQ